MRYPKLGDIYNSTGVITKWWTITLLRYDIATCSYQVMWHDGELTWLQEETMLDNIAFGAYKLLAGF